MPVGTIVVQESPIFTAKEKQSGFTPYNYKTISRINHSCAPNVFLSWIQGDESKVEKQVRVVREIKEGEEILVRYWGANKFASKDKRQEELRNWWDITSCICEVCSLTGDKLIENERARKKIRDLHADAEVKQTVGLPKLAYEAAKEKLKIMRSMEKEMVADLPMALGECGMMASVCNLPTAEFMKEAKDMSELFGDNYVNLYMKTKEMIEMNRLDAAMNSM